MRYTTTCEATRPTASCSLRRLAPDAASTPAPPIAVTTLSIVADLMGRLPMCCWVYYGVDDFGEWPGLDQKPLQWTEKEVLAQADVVVAGSETLQERNTRSSVGRHTAPRTEGLCIMLVPVLLRKLLFPLAERLTRTRFWSYYADSLRYERWGGEEREALRNRRLSEVLNAALGSALHRKRLEEAGLAARLISLAESRSFLEGLRPVSKVDFRRHFPTGVTTSDHSAAAKAARLLGLTPPLRSLAPNGCG